MFYCIVIYSFDSGCLAVRQPLFELKTSKNQLLEIKLLYLQTFMDRTIARLE